MLSIHGHVGLKKISREREGLLSKCLPCDIPMTSLLSLFFFDALLFSCDLRPTKKESYRQLKSLATGPDLFGNWRTIQNHVFRPATPRSAASRRFEGVRAKAHESTGHRHPSPNSPRTESGSRYTCRHFRKVSTSIAHRSKDRPVVRSIDKSRHRPAIFRRFRLRPQFLFRRWRTAFFVAQRRRGHRTFGL